MKRIIPSLTLFSEATWVTRNFQKRLSAGDLINSIRFFSEMDADELQISIPSFDPNRSIMELVERAINTATVPLSIAGNFARKEDIDSFFNWGVDKVNLRVSKPLIPMIRYIATKFGSQSICGVVYTDEILEDFDQLGLIEEALDSGIGELLLIDVKNEGSLSGLKLERFHAVSEVKLGVPVLIRGGISSSTEISKLLEIKWVSGVVASSYFMCTSDGKSILPNYELEELHEFNM